MKSKLNRRTLISGVAIFICLPLLIGAVMAWKMTTTTQSYVEDQISGQAAVLGQLASRRLSDRLDELGRVSGYLTRIEESRMDAAISQLLGSSPSQTSGGILRLDGTPVTGRSLLSSEYPAIQNAFLGKPTVRYRSGEGLLFTTPIYSENGSNIRYALYEFYDQYVLFEGFQEGCFHGKASVMLADRDQGIVVPISQGMTETNPFFQRQEIQDAFSQLALRRTEAAPSVYCESQGDGYVLFVSQLAQNNLYLVGVVPYVVAAHGLASLTGMVLLVFSLLLVLLILGVARMISADARARESDALREAKAAAEEASKSKSAFLANMSHELRTPINTIMGMDEMILRETGETDTRERAMDVKSAAQILLGLINDVLDFSKIESGMLQIIPVEYDLVSLIRDLDLLSENRARSKSLDFRLDIQPDLPVGLFGDDIRLRQVLINLLTNAVKYTNKGGVTLRMSGTRSGDDVLSLHCEVVDTGIGIKQEDLDRGFVAYKRMDEARNRNVEGTGLGLTIITGLLHLMGSELQVHSVYGEGSTFFFDVEQKVVDPEPIGDIYSRLDNMIKQYEYRVTIIAPKARVLVVDDNSMNRKIFGSLLKQTQIQVDTASSGPKCLDMVQKEHYDLIFMDHLMPGMDGVETLHRLKELDGNLCKDVPVIALTANAFTGAREKYLSVGFDAFLSKPIVTEKLETLLREMLPHDLVTEVPLSAVQPTPAGECELPVVEGVNWEFAKLHVQDQDILMEGLRMFYQNLDKDYRDIGDLARRVDEPDGLDAYRIRVHALKSTAAMVGVLSVSELAKLLEHAAKEGRTDKITADTPTLLEELLKMKERLSPVMEQQEEDQKPMGDPSQLPALLDMLRAAMDDMDIQAADSALAQINAHSYAPELQEILDELTVLESNLDFAGAGAAANRLLEQLAGMAEN